MKGIEEGQCASLIFKSADQKIRTATDGGSFLEIGFSTYIFINS